MRSAKLLCALLCALPAVASAQTTEKKLVKNADPQYLNQPPPGMTAQVFAPGIVSNKDVYEYSNSFSKDGKEFFWAVIENNKPHIRYVRLGKDGWTQPVKVVHDPQYEHNDPFLSPDGQKLFFISDRAIDGKGPKKDFDIWYVKREKNGWSAPINAGPEINSDKNEYYMSFTKGGKMYFSSNRGTDQAHDKNYDVYTVSAAGDAFTNRQKVSSAVNSEHYEADVFVSPYEQYVIFCGERPDGQGEGDLYISFRDEKGGWLPAKNMGPAINTKAYEFCPFVSADGKYLFFSRSGDIFWISADVIKSLK